jgi:hypothetical protein
MACRGVKYPAPNDLQPLPTIRPGAVWTIHVTLLSGFLVFSWGKSQLFSRPLRAAQINDLGLDTSTTGHTSLYCP